MSYIKILKDSSIRVGNITCMGIDPDHESIPYEDKTRYEIVKEFEEGLEKMIKMKPYREPLFNIGFINQEYFQKYNVAIDYYSKAIELSPLYFTAIYNRGLCYEKIGDLKNAENDFRKTLKINNDYDFAAIALDRVLKSR